jgi:hypothetical protein
MATNVKILKMIGKISRGKVGTRLQGARKRNKVWWLELWRAHGHFEYIALLLGKLIHDVCPFRTREAYNDILVGMAGPGVSHTGYLGWNVYDIIQKQWDTYISLYKLKALLKSPLIREQLRDIFELSQKYLILPMMKVLFEKGEDFYQGEMNRHLNMAALDNKKRQQGWVTAELFTRLCVSNIMEKYKEKKEGKSGTVYHRKKANAMCYQPPSFVMPTKIGFSKGHQRTLNVLEPLVQMWNVDQKIWKVTNEHYNPDKHGYKRRMRYDIALWKNEVLYGLLEFDGKQHYEYTPHFHRRGISQFEELQKKDRIKNADALKLCNGRKCIRFRASDADSDIREKILAWVV